MRIDSSARWLPVRVRLGGAAPPLVRRLMALALAMSACTKPGIPPVDLGGNWTGSLASSSSGIGTLHLALHDEPLILTGSGGANQHLLTGVWMASFSTTARTDTGTFQGWAWTYTDTVTLALSDSAKCVMNLIGTRTGKPSMSGRFATSGCAVSDSGTFLMSRE